MTNLAENLPDSPEKSFQENFEWKNNLPVQNLLDVIVTILAEEYIQTAKNNPDIFTQ